MSPLHHISDDLLVDYASAQPNEAVSLVVACHLALCGDCRAVISLLDEVGALYEQRAEPREVDRSPLTSALARLDNVDRHGARAELPLILAPLRPSLDVARLADVAWTPIVPGHWRAHLAVDAGGGELLGRFGAGWRVPTHGHPGRELVMAIAGGFSQGGAPYAVGDIAIADETFEHEVRVDADGECIALISTEIADR